MRSRIGIIVPFNRDFFNLVAELAGQGEHFHIKTELGNLGPGKYVLGRFRGYNFKPPLGIKNPRQEHNPRVPT